MKRIILFSAAAVLLAFLLPLLLRPELLKKPAEESPSPEPEESGPSPAPVADAELSLQVKTEAGVVSMSMEEYLPGAVAGEMPAAFEPEALKAQTVALRSYALYCREHRKSDHPDADVCGSPGCCAALTAREEMRQNWGERFEEYYEKIRTAVRDTDGQYLLWQGGSALAVFHSSSLGSTESSAALWGETPYLVSVDSPETETDVKNLVTTVEVSPEDFAASVRGLYPDAVLSGPPEGWLGALKRTDGGRVQSLLIGGEEISGTALRSLFSLRSTDFDLAYSDARFVFTVRGYGHGVGMSQYGANVMARQGAGYDEILSHYYPGTELVVSMRYTRS